MTYIRDAKRLSSLLAMPAFVPTQEQTDIIEAAKTGKDLVVQAYAGSGKTATAAAIANTLKKPGCFVVFARAARLDAQHRMPNGMKATTGHALAHDYVIKTSPGYQNKLERNTSRTGVPPSIIADYLALRDRPEIGATAKQQAMAIAATISAFEISASRTIDVGLIPEAAIPMNVRLSSDFDEMDSFKHFILDQTVKVWEIMADEHNGFPISHDTYLKLFHLRDPYINSKLWLLDEFQDTTPVFDAIIQHQEGQKIYIGDPYQAIFGWRGAIDALKRPVEQGTEKHHLTMSWRFNHQIAGAANILLSRLGETVPLRGQQYNLRQIDLHKHHTVLVRNNIRMLSVIGDYLDRRQSVYIPGGLSTEAMTKAASAWALARNQPNEIKVSALRDLGSWHQFRDIAEKYGEQNPEYSDLVSLIELHGKRLPDIFAHAQRSWAEISSDPGRITLTTAHKAKGKEFGYVLLSDDLALPSELVTKMRDGAGLTMAEREQVHLLYVAITRAKKGLSLAPRIKQNFLDLQHSDSATVAQIRLKKPHFTSEEIQNRTDKFVAKHRKPKTKIDNEE